MGRCCHGGASTWGSSLSSVHVPRDVINQKNWRQKNLQLEIPPSVKKASSVGGPAFPEGIAILSSWMGRWKQTAPLKHLPSFWTAEYPWERVICSSVELKDVLILSLLQRLFFPQLRLLIHNYLSNTWLQCYRRKNSSGDFHGRKGGGGGELSTTSLHFLICCQWQITISWGPFAVK